MAEDTVGDEHLHWGDGLVILGYFVAVIAVGIWVISRSQDFQSDFSGQLCFQMYFVLCTCMKFETFLKYRLRVFNDKMFKQGILVCTKLI